MLFVSTVKDYLLLLAGTSELTGNLTHIAAKPIIFYLFSWLFWFLNFESLANIGFCLLEWFVVHRVVFVDQGLFLVLWPMYLKASLRHNPAVKDIAAYYRLVESYRDEFDRVYHKTFLNIGFWLDAQGCAWLSHLRYCGTPALHTHDRVVLLLFYLMVLVNPDFSLTVFDLGMEQCGCYCYSFYFLKGHFLLQGLLSLLLTVLFFEVMFV